MAAYPRSQAQQPRIDYRHVIDSLVRKPGAFAQYLYREELFPRPVFRQAYDRLRALQEPTADARYLQLLLLAAETEYRRDDMQRAIKWLIDARLRPE